MTRTICVPPSFSLLQSKNGYTLDHTPTDINSQKKSKHNGALRTEGQKNWAGKSTAMWVLIQIQTDISFIIKRKAYKLTHVHALTHCGSFFPSQQAVKLVSSRCCTGIVAAKNAKSEGVKTTTKFSIRHSRRHVFIRLFFYDQYADVY